MKRRLLLTRKVSTVSQSNGKVENSAKTAKIILKKAPDASYDPHLDFRNTPSEGMDSTPAQRLFSRSTRNSLPIASHLLQPKVIPDVHRNFQQRQNKQALSFNRGARPLQPLRDGDVVWVRPLPGHSRCSRWFKAQVSSRKLHAAIKSTQRMAESTAEPVQIFTKFLRTFKRCQTRT